MATYDVFVSSTFADFEKERERLHDLLKLVQVNVRSAETSGHTGKSLAEELYKIIDKCEMVVLLVGARAGSDTGMGVTWTRFEIEYALSKGKRVFVYKRKAEKNQSTRFDLDATKQEQLTEFVEMLERKISLVPRWKKCCELTAMVIRDVDRYANELRRRDADDDYGHSFQ